MKIGVIIVSYDNKVDSTELINQLDQQLDINDRVVVIDNNPNHHNANSLEKLTRINHLIRNKNVGFGAACNQGADLIKNEVDAFLFLNPDTLLGDDTIRKYKKINRKHSAYMANLLTQKGKINNDGSIVHISGLSWSGNYLKEYNSNKSEQYSEINYCSGACLFIWKNDFYEIGKFYDEYFLYYEDTDLSSRIILSGKKIALINDAFVYHDYDSSVSEVKYLSIQRNRYMYILINWPIKVILLLLPAIAIIDILLVVHSILEGRFILKIKSYLELIKKSLAIYNLRNKTQKLKKINTSEYIKTLSPRLDSELIPKFLGINILNDIFVLYFNLVKKLLD